MPMPAPDFSWHFTEGNTFTEESGTTGTLRVVPGGELWLHTGRVIACDPFVALGAGEAEPFTARVDPGRYRVDAAVATLVREEEPEQDTPHLRVAAARLVIKDAPTVAWELALQPGQDLGELGDDEFFGYGVDAGTGCFYDAGSDGSFPDCEGDEGPLWDAFATAPDVSPAPGPHTITDPATGHNLIAFTSGWGDGTYPTWIGRDATGAITCFVTDFFVVPAEALAPLAP